MHIFQDLKALISKLMKTATTNMNAGKEAKLSVRSGFVVLHCAMGLQCRLKLKICSYHHKILLRYVNQLVYNTWGVTYFSKQINYIHIKFKWCGLQWGLGQS